MTLNEPLVYLGQGWFRGIWPPHRPYPLAALRTFRHLLLAHAAAYEVIHTIQPHANVGYAKAVRLFTGSRPGSYADRYAAGLKRYLFEHIWFTAARDGRIRPPAGLGEYHANLADSCDYIGINYYARNRVRFTPNPRRLFGTEELDPVGEFSDSGQSGPYSSYQPDGLYQICTELKPFGKPIYIMENGLPDADDDQRPRWLLGHLYHLHAALTAGCDIRGYFHWTFVDNFEWNEGWSLRFGLVELDPITQRRTARPSAGLYGEIARTNRISARMLQEHAPNLEGG
jgi:beta-glucosidase